MSSTKVLPQVIREWSEVFMRHSARDFRQFMAGASISMSQVGVLMRLFHQGRCGVSDISDEMGITLAAASQSIDRLVNAGLLARTEDPLDRRQKNLELTPKGREMVKSAIEARSRWVEDVASNLSPEQQEMIANSLMILTEAVQKLDN